MRHTPPKDIDSWAREFQRPLLRHVASRVAHKGDAEDLAQDVWVRASAYTDGPVRNVRAWLFRIARNLIIDHRRKAARAAEFVADPDAMDHIADERENPEAAALNREELRRIDALLAAMPERPRQVFRMHRLEGLGFAEIGRRLGLKRQTVHDYMMRALLALQLAAEDRYDPDA
ncbi:MULTISPECIES: RNA polymerase sigma factor [unclassified Sphingobium]|uniref:RNA polymerase sigma factor n=1 Tax=unclassified Sphingobium TaxID=2611147 RepID=UPI000D15DE62|nr:MULTISPECIES: RNA polymerase sigma factor [unclassified Sphingobium]PSO10847.1 RNA polymerase subunit sigma [Sphingobium sp. AEW4]TWD04430.1 RNA polymerase sigma-70 factor (ECF subfamily) [Sphingobium sp. AEW010]TWD21901.1 RNA polymerase sigma-70 factor (ECF subfamily) [Sphingobium sp. AEW013]TWD24583.1 RNA polymerase sigma-70 factor (ECF subfamily) [Sphingobium sp. AEW001]